MKNEDRKKSTFRDDKKENKKIQIKNFDPTTTSAQKLNEVLKLPVFEMKKYAEIFIEPWKAEYHFNLIDYLHKEDDEVLKDIIGTDEGKGGLNDFTIEQIKHRSFKIDLFNRVRNKVFHEKNGLPLKNKRQLEMNPPNKKGIRGTADKELSKKELMDIYKVNAMANNDEAEYIKECNEEAFQQTTQDIIYLLANSLFPEEVIVDKRRNIKRLDENGEVMRAEPDEKNKKGKILYDKETYLFLDDKEITKHKHLAWFRQNNGEDNTPNIEDYDDSVRRVIHEGLDLLHFFLFLKPSKISEGFGTGSLIRAETTFSDGNLMNDSFSYFKDICYNYYNIFFYKLLF